MGPRPGNLSFELSFWGAGFLSISPHSLDPGVSTISFKLVPSDLKFGELRILSRAPSACALSTRWYITWNLSDRPLSSTQADEASTSLNFLSHHLRVY